MDHGVEIGQENARTLRRLIAHHYYSPEKRGVMGNLELLDRKLFLERLSLLSFAAVASGCASESGLIIPSPSSLANQSRKAPSGARLISAASVSAFPLSNGGNMSVSTSGSVVTVSATNAAGQNLGSFTVSANTAAKTLTYAGPGIGTLVTTPSQPPSGAVSLLNHVISPSSSSVASINGSIITAGNATGSTSVTANGTSLVTSAGGNGFADQTYTRVYNFGGTGGGCKLCPNVASVPPGWMNWFMWGLGAVATVIGAVALFVTLPIDLLIFAVVAGVISSIWALLEMLGW